MIILNHWSWIIDVPHQDAFVARPRLTFSNPMICRGAWIPGGPGKARVKHFCPHLQPWLTRSQFINLFWDGEPGCGCGWNVNSYVGTGSFRIWSATGDYRKGERQSWTSHISVVVQHIDKSRSMVRNDYFQGSLGFNIVQDAWWNMVFFEEIR